MFKKPKKQLYILRRVLISVIATAAVLIIATASIFFMLGYRLDSGNGRLEQGSLLQFDSTPNGATIWIDGEQIGSQTAAKRTVLAGVHSVKLTKAGYEDWNRTLRLDAGTLTWLDYVRMVPKERTVEAVKSYQTLAGLTFSPDKKWALALPKANTPILQVIDLRSEDVKTTELVLPSSLYATDTTAKNSKFSMYRWNSQGRYVILKHTYGDKKTEWLMVDTQDVAKSVNITRRLSVQLSDVRFIGSSGTSLYGLTDDRVIRKLDLSAETISRALITQVNSFSVLEDTNVVSYVGIDPRETSTSVVGIYRDGDTAPSILHSNQDTDAQLSIALGRYFGDTYVAIADGTMVTVFTGTLPSGGTRENSLQTYGDFTLHGDVTRLSFSEKGDYVLAQSGSAFMSYEIEHKRATTGALITATKQPVGALRWLDTDHLWNDDMDTLVMRDFDGSNAFSIMPVAGGFDASLSTNGKFFYAVGKNSDGYQLQRVRMILN